MAAPTINNIVLPNGTILVTPDGPDPDEATTGVIFKHSEMGGARFHDQNGGAGTPAENTHILFVKEMTTEVIVDSVEYLSMHESAIVGIIP